MQEKRYQIFLSSTFSDLEEERRKVMQTLLEMDCIPSGMEFFPASDEETFDFIKTVIDQSDYYILILSGRYGSLAPDGKSYTEKEYDYAVSIGKPILSFVKRDLSQITLSKTDNDSALAEKLTEFREKVIHSGRLCRMWDNADQLAGQVSTTLNTAVKRYPAVGWMRGNQIASAEILAEINDLRKENIELKKEISASKAYINVENLAELETKYEISYSYDKPGYGIRKDYISLEWNRIAIATLQELTEGQTIATIERKLINFIKEKEHINRTRMSVDNTDMRQIVIQLELLGFITSDNRKSTDGQYLEFFFRTETGKKFVYENLAIKSDVKI